MVSLTRRAWLLQAALVGCAQTEAPPRPPDALLTPWRQWPGGFLSPTVPGAGGLPLAGSGTYVRFNRAAAIALRGVDLLLADLPAGRLWRCDTGFNTVTGVAGAPVSPGMALALGPDLSAWLLDPTARQVLRFARDGRLLRSLNLPIGLPSPVGLALADSGTTVLVADGLGARWAELRGSLAVEVRPTGPEGARVQGVDALAVTPAGVYLLDRQSAVVHLARSDGTVLATRGQGQLLQPTALAVDRLERVFVLDARDHGLVCLRPDGSAERLGPARLGVQQVGALAVDDLMLAVADGLSGQVVVHRLGRSGVP